MVPSQHLLYPQKEFVHMGPIKNPKVPIFIDHHISVPFGCSPAQIESELLKFVIELVSPKEMQNVKKLFFVPIGLPGMGKSTLSKHIKLAIETNLSDYKLARISKTQKKHDHQQLPNQLKLELQKTFGNTLPSVSYHKVSYDRILGENLSAYSELHPEVPFHEVIDIIRSKAD